MCTLPATRRHRVDLSSGQTTPLPPSISPHDLSHKSHAPERKVYNRPSHHKNTRQNRLRTTKPHLLFRMANNNNDNRFYLNINNNNERPGYNDRAYPTTPSTFPNPIFPSQGQQQSQQSQQQAPSNQNSQFATPFAPTGYFSNPQYPPSYPQQPPTTYQPGPHAVAQQPGYQPRVPPIQADATNGLVHQFSHQNLGGASRTGTYSNRPTGGAQRPRTAGAPGQQPAYSSYHNAPMPGHGSQQRSYAEFEVAPERNPNRYGHAVTVHQKGAINLAETFFKDNVKRARDRNVRCVIV